MRYEIYFNANSDHFVSMYKDIGQQRDIIVTREEYEGYGLSINMHINDVVYILQSKGFTVNYAEEHISDYAYRIVAFKN